MNLKDLAKAAAQRKKADPAALADVARRRKIESGNLYSHANAGMFPQGVASAAVDMLDPVKGDPTAATAIVDNVVGLDNGVMSPGEKLATALNKGGESLTLGVVGDEAAAAADSLIGRGDYASRRDKYRADERQLAEENPGASLAAEVAPAFIPGAGAAGMVGKIGSKLGRTGAGALTGAAAAGLYGFNEGEGGLSDRADNAKGSAIAGAIFGAAAPKVTDFALSVPGRVRNLFVSSAKRPTVAALKATKNAAYKAVDDAGEVFDGDTMTQLSEHVRRTFEADNYVPETDSALNATLKLLDKRAGQPTTLTQLDKLRQNLWKRYAGAKDQPQILDAIASIDHVINTRGSTSELMQVARAANARYAKSQLLEDAFTKATDQTAATGSGGNILNKYRQAVTSIINNPKKAKFFTDGEIEMMRGFVRGSTGENLKRLAGKLSPSGNGLMMALHVIGGVASNGASLPLMAAGALAKNSADKSAMRGAGAIQDFVAGVPRQLTGNSTGAALAVGSAPAAERLQTEVRNMLNLGQLVPR